MNNAYIEEELTLFEFSEKFLLNNDVETPEVFDLSDYDIEVETLNKNGELVWAKINKFFVKDGVNSHYTDGNIKVSSNHRFVIDGKETYPHELEQFIKIDEPIPIVDIEVADEHTYLASGYLNHNTVSGGSAIPFTASVRLRTKIISRSSKNMDGESVEVTIVKNRFGPPRKKVVFDIRYDSGIDNYGSWLNALKDFGVLRSAGSLGYAYDFIDEETGELITKKFKEEAFEKLLEETPGLKETIYGQICDAYIMKYSTGEHHDEEIENDIED